MNPVTPILPIRTEMTAPAAFSPQGIGMEGSFADHLKTSIQTVEGMGQAAGKSIEKFLNGEGEELHQVAMAVQKAEISFDLLMQTRNKVVQAYQEIMRMQL